MTLPGNLDVVDVGSDPKEQSDGTLAGIKRSHKEFELAAETHRAEVDYAKKRLCTLKTKRDELTRDLDAEINAVQKKMTKLKLDNFLELLNRCRKNAHVIVHSDDLYNALNGKLRSHSANNFDEITERGGYIFGDQVRVQTGTLICRFALKFMPSKLYNVDSAINCIEREGDGGHEFWIGGDENVQPDDAIVLYRAQDLVFQCEWRYRGENWYHGDLRIPNDWFLLTFVDGDDK